MVIDFESKNEKEEPAGEVDELALEKKHRIAGEPGRRNARGTVDHDDPNAYERTDDEQKPAIPRAFSCI